jgi:hypothetical protein
MPKINNNFVRWYTPKLAKELNDSIVPFIDKAIEEQVAPANELRRAYSVVSKISDCSRTHVSKALRGAPKHFDHYYDFGVSKGYLTPESRAAYDSPESTTSISEHKAYMESPEGKIGQYFRNGGPCYDYIRNPAKVVKEATALLEIARLQQQKDALKIAIEIATDFVGIREIIEKLEGYKLTKAKEKYRAPKESVKTCREIHDLLVKITKDTHDQLVNQWIDRINSVVDNFLANVKPEQSSYAFYHKKQKYPNKFAYDLVTKFVEATRHGNLLSDTTYNHRKRLDYPILVRAEAERRVLEMEQMFISKNIRKLNSIVEKKGNFSKATLLRTTTSAGLVEGDIRVEFADSTAFEVRNQLVWSHSVQGTVFTRYPTTFHNIKTLSGLHKFKPEQWMNENFI